MTLAVLLAQFGRISHQSSRHFVLAFGVVFGIEHGALNALPPIWWQSLTQISGHRLLQPGKLHLGARIEVADGDRNRAR